MLMEKLVAAEAAHKLVAKELAELQASSPVEDESDRHAFSFSASSLACLLAKCKASGAM